MSLIEKKQLGENIKRAREAKDWTAAETARACEMPGHQLASYERGRVYPQLVTLARVAEVLDVTVIDLLKVD